jgi:hypothetical protein
MTANRKTSLSDLPGQMENEASQSQGNNTLFVRKLQALALIGAFLVGSGRMGFWIYLCVAILGGVFS